METAPTKAKFFSILHRRILFCGLGIAVLCAVFPGTMVAQEEHPQIIPGERKAPRKKDAGPRAVAVLRLAKDGKASLVPIAILVNGKFWDATAYKADPVPMALESGTVYEAERSGNSLGLFTVGGALRSRAANAQVPWIGTGAWRPTGTEPETKEIKANNAPVGIDTDDKPPWLTHKPKETGAADSTAGSASSTSAQPPVASKPASTSSGDEPPRLSKPAPTSSTVPPAGSTSNPSQQTPRPPSIQEQAKPAESKSDNHSGVAASDSGTSEANRPRLRRGKPTESFADEEIPGYRKPGENPAASSANAGTVVDAVADMSDLQLIPAISDAGGPQPRSFGFEWLKDEEGERRQQMMTMAKNQLHGYVQSISKARITPKAEHASPGRHVSAARPVEPIFENVQMVAYDLWNSNQPVMVFSTEAHMPLSAEGGLDSNLQYSILLVAYPDIYNNLHKLYVGVTDKYHLDVTPRLELVDAVDADGDGRGELLFRETSDAGSGWAVYRATADKLWKMFDSLSPE